MGRRPGRSAYPQAGTLATAAPSLHYATWTRKSRPLIGAFTSLVCPKLNLAAWPFPRQGAFIDFQPLNAINVAIHTNQIKIFPLRRIGGTSKKRQAARPPCPSTISTGAGQCRPGPYEHKPLNLSHAQPYGPYLAEKARFSSQFRPPRPLTRPGAFTGFQPLNAIN